METGTLIALLPQRDWFLPNYIVNDCGVVINEDILLKHNPKCASNKNIGFEIRAAQTLGGKTVIVQSYNGSTEGWSSPVSDYAIDYNQDVYEDADLGLKDVLIDLRNNILNRTNKDKVAVACITFIEKYLA
jgi:hypothetical protein